MATPSPTSLAVAGAPSYAPSSSSASSPCAACKFLRRKCQPDCVFAPYFPPDNPQKFVQVHRVFGASNVTKLLTDLNPLHREDAVNSLAYEAEARLHDPVNGCLRDINLLQQNLHQVQMELAAARAQLAQFQPALVNFHHPHYALAFHHQQQQQQQQQQMMMLQNYDAEMTARVVGVSDGAYDGVVVPSVNAGPFTKSGLHQGQT